MNRRGFLRGFLAAPAIVSAANIMPVKALLMPAPSIIPSAADIVPLGGMPVPWSDVFEVMRQELYRVTGIPAEYLR